MHFIAGDKFIVLHIVVDIDCELTRTHKLLRWNSANCAIVKRCRTPTGGNASDYGRTFDFQPIREPPHVTIAVQRIIEKIPAKRRQFKKLAKPSQGIIDYTVTETLAMEPMFAKLLRELK